MIREAIAKLAEGKDLSEEESSGAIKEILEGKGTSAQIAAFIMGLRVKGEKIPEILGGAKAIRKMALTLKIKAETAVDTCGTGGDGANTFNISTAAAFVVAGAGVTVAKHGNRAVSSHCGSADILRELGVNIDLSPDKVARCIDEIGIGFLFAPLFHSAMQYAAGPRREIGIRSIFNILGPLTNPAEVKSQVLGVYDKKLTAPLAHVLGQLGTRRSFVVCGLDGLDEITITDATQISEFYNGEVKTYQITPEEFGLKRSSLDELAGGDAFYNKEILIRILKGAKNAKRDIVLINASAALVASEKAKDFKDGILLAEESIDSGKAYKKLESLIEFSNRK
ncbi:MAG: anthranilate phosphoribosyltransferase [Candidatus Schekmanbacteria bacterium RBG_16_38_11]|uniref:Anthranilate phosphoribosyltransferase n=1 Tax=Candidatus Schekmanbacteria bacterium RBG_16_38_11 TaxID=1817880 RepID=A0A1F7RTF2_9BACT|nr:MAG: anthranilate phosphoribosyltransferase [Candidatus Schekmanbacteria bacterium RBG_16_38_11]